MANPAPLPNIPRMSAAYTTIAQEMTLLGNETALFTNAGPINIAAQLAQLTAAVTQLTATVNGLAGTVAANHQTAQANHAALVVTVNANHATAQANHATAQANHATAQANHNTVLQQLADLNASLALQPMRLANASAGPNGGLVGPAMTPLAAPHPLTREALLVFTIADCTASSNAFAAGGHALEPLPNAPVLQDRRRQLARFLGVSM
ncbi:hypothetical protein B0H14DRAFT_2715113 [Mycena olivaceomarginata]|nr:hypothetical protein B0H14DRAFT_2715113 [Mycena olivaceomarginata]